MSKRGLPTGVIMRHDSHYVEDLARINRTVGRIIPVRSGKKRNTNFIRESAKFANNIRRKK